MIITIITSYLLLNQRLVYVQGAHLGGGGHWVANKETRASLSSLYQVRV